MPDRKNPPPLPRFAITNNNDVGPGDEGFWEWFEVVDNKEGGETIAKCDSERWAETIASLLNEHYKG